MNRKVILDIAERTIWTGIQAAAASLIVLGFNRESLYVALTAGGLAILKCITATKVGSSDSAAALPNALESKV